MNERLRGLAFCVVVLAGLGVLAAFAGPVEQPAKLTCSAETLEGVEFYGEVMFEQDWITFLPYNNDGDAFAYRVSSWGEKIQPRTVSGWFSVLEEKDEVLVEVYGDDGSEFARWFGTADYVAEKEGDDEQPSCSCHYHNVCSAQITCNHGERAICECRKRSTNDIRCTARCIPVKPKQLVSFGLQVPDRPVQAD
jgi:hypothetical protein